jgi:hypothetical protein
VRQHEPDRSSGPAADRTLQKAQSTAGSSTTSSATDDTGAGQGQSAPPTGSQDPAQNGASGGSQPVGIAVDTNKVSASVNAAGVKASVSVDLQKPQNTQVTIKCDKAGNRGIDSRQVTDKVNGTVKKLTDGLGKKGKH